MLGRRDRGSITIQNVFDYLFRRGAIPLSGDTMIGHGFASRAPQCLSCRQRVHFREGQRRRRGANGGKRCDDKAVCCEGADKVSAQIDCILPPRPRAKGTRRTHTESTESTHGGHQGTRGGHRGHHATSHDHGSSHHHLFCISQQAI